MENPPNIITRRNFIKKTFAGIALPYIITHSPVFAGEDESTLYSKVSNKFITGDIEKEDLLKQIPPALPINSRLDELHNAYSKKPSTREIRFGVACDIHSERGKAEKIADIFRREDVEAILVPGDFSNYSFININFGEEKEIRASLTPLLEIGKPVYVIPGNHESKSGYRTEIKRLEKQFNNLYDLEKIKHVPLNGVNLVGVCGGDIPALGGYQIKDYINQMEKDIENGKYNFNEDPILMLSHMPPRFEYSGSIDCVYNVITSAGSIIHGRHAGERAIYEGEATKRINPKNRGLKNLTELFSQGINFSVSGHFHGNWGGSDMDRNIPTKEYSEKLHINPGAVKFERAGFFTLKDRKANYELFKVS
ncbi:MAG: metallophosphoesterase family protein [Candidatus Nanoarchaeia archaeon]